MGDRLQLPVLTPTQRSSGSRLPRLLLQNLDAEHGFKRLALLQKKAATTVAPGSLQQMSCHPTSQRFLVTNSSPHGMLPYTMSKKALAPCDREAGDRLQLGSTHAHTSGRTVGAHGLPNQTPQGQ